MRAFKKYGGNRGFTLVELMIVVAIIGVLAALAIYGVSRYLASAKTSEAKNTVGAIVRGGIGAYERETTAAQSLGEGVVSTAFNHDVCSSGAFGAFVPSVPAAMASIAGTKYQPITKDGDFDSGTELTGWRCIKFTMSSPIYYQYTYSAKTLAGAAPAEFSAGGVISPGGGVTVNPAATIAFTNAAEFEVGATGNVDGDTLFSFFSQVAAVNSTSREIKEGTQIYSNQEYE